MNTSFEFRKAVKYDAKLRLAVWGPSGSGKTYTLLKLASELGGPVAFVDTERGSASKYADLFDFEVLELASFDPSSLIGIIETAASSGYRVLCIDSLSHFWMGKDGELDKVDQIVKHTQANNSFLAWKQVTPIHNRLIDAIISSPIHILASLRVKTEWVLERDERTGKMIPRKVGLAPVMREGIEYEFDVCGELDQDNTLVITKSRCPRLTRASFHEPGQEMAEMLQAWLSGPEALQPVMPETPEPEAPANEYKVLPQELATIWKRMCSPRGVTSEFEALRAAFIQIAPDQGGAEYDAILKKHGVERVSDFKSSQPARLCAKDLFLAVQRLQANDTVEAPAAA